jgi:hypothetical protein
MMFKIEFFAEPSAPGVLPSPLGTPMTIEMDSWENAHRIAVSNADTFNASCFQIESDGEIKRFVHNSERWERAPDSL